MMTGAISTYTISVDNDDVSLTLALALGGFVGVFTIAALIIYKISHAEVESVATGPSSV